MKILVINSGSSSLKFQLFDMQGEEVLASGIVERIGEPMGSLTYKKLKGGEKKFEEERVFADHYAGMRRVAELLADAKEYGVIANASEIVGVGHRVVHGGENFTHPTIVTPEVVDEIESLRSLAPLHCLANAAGIRVSLELFPDAPQVVVFDTAFHQTMAPEAYMYAVPYELYEKFKVRRYGFHGTSHKYVAGEAARVLGKPAEEVNVITVHLGNGCSMDAVKGGVCIDTSMGLTPLAGLVMGTRSGDIDPAVFTFLGREKGLSIDEIDHILNKEGGLKGICGMNDMRDVHAAIEKGDERAELALNMACYRVRKYIGSYMAALGRTDAIVFTAGIGENDDIVRELSVAGLEGLGVVLDKAANKGRVKEPKAVHAPESKVAVLVIPTNEELAIARETRDLLSK